MATKKRSAGARPVEFKSWRDLSPLNTSVGPMLHNLTGSWRFLRPVYENRTAPCRAACPAGNDIEAWITLASRGDYRAAYEHLRREQPFPAVLGRVCFNFCRGVCNRGPLDAAVVIHELERYIGDAGLAEGALPETPELHGLSLGVVGSGPAGLAAAYFARRLGFDVTVFDARAEAGGVLRYGIPAYRLPRETLAAEVKVLVDMGVRFTMNTAIGPDISMDDLRRRYDYVFAAGGAEVSGEIGLEHPRVRSALAVLREIASGRPVDLGRRVLVIGGGNTAVDAARSAVRLGAEVTVVYRRTEEDMPAHPEEIAAAREEGVEFCFQAAPERIEQGETCRLVCCEMEAGEPDESGRARPVRKDGSEFALDADTVLTAVGESPDTGWLPSADLERGRVQAGAEPLVLPAQEGLAPVYAGGDMVDEPRTVIHAVAAGKRAALAVDSSRRGLDWAEVEAEIAVGGGPALSFGAYLDLPSPLGAEANPDRVVGPEDIVYDYFDKAPPVEPAEAPAVHRKRSFDPYRRTYTEDQARSETARCLHCGRCTGCDNCLVFCPEMSVLVDGRGRYSIDYDYCKGCGICAAECPRGAITLIEEQAAAEAEE